MNRLFLYLVGIGVLILVMIAAWEVIQIASGVKSMVNQAVIELPRDRIFTQQESEFLKEKELSRSGLAN